MLRSRDSSRAELPGVSVLVTGLRAEVLATGLLQHGSLQACSHAAVSLLALGWAATGAHPKPKPRQRPNLVQTWSSAGLCGPRSSGLGCEALVSGGQL